MAATLMTALLTLPLAFLAQLFADALKAVPGFRVVDRTQVVPCHGQLVVAVTDELTARVHEVVERGPREGGH